MPNCPICGHRLAFYPTGSICPGCGKEYTPFQTSRLPGYNLEDALIDSYIYQVLDDLGLLRNGVTQIDITSDGWVLTRLGEPD